MSDTITILPNDTYAKLKSWHDNFGNMSNSEFCEGYKDLHQRIAHDDYSKLDEREWNLLNELMVDSAKIITRDNLWWYVENFDRSIRSVQGLQDSYKRHLGEYEFNKADLLLHECPNYLENSDNVQLFNYFKKRQIDEEYRNLLKQFKFNDAEILLQKNKKYLDDEKYRILRNESIDQFNKDEYENLLERFDFQEADEYFKNNKDEIEQKIFEEDKAKFIEKYFSDILKTKIIPDAEQAEAIGALGKNILVTARAGSGKTQTISGKAALLMKKYGIKSQEILVLCFNRDAANGMKSRIKTLVPNFENAITFHAWAWSIVDPPRHSVLFDIEKSFSPKEYSAFVRKIIEDCAIKDKDFKENIYNFFREEYEQIDQNLSETKSFKNEEDRFLYLRNKSEVTLSGIPVKSRGEKWIGDYLFEHGIDFYYEQQFSWDSLDDRSHYHPDFTIKTNDQKYILEHWGIDEHDVNREVPDHWEKTWDEYREEMEQKREYFENNEKFKNKFLETSICDIKYSLPLAEQRKEFEKMLKTLLESKGIVHKKQSRKDLIEKAWKKQLFNQLNGQIGSFIQWMQQLEWTEEDLRAELEKSIYNEKQRTFCEIGLTLYNEYLSRLKSQNKIDFNILMSQATERIKDGKMDISQFRYILIDEFQDFSQLFQNLVNAIVEKNPEISLFCVGDDWQLINGFAGSDERFFKEFEKKANTKQLSTCYRSTSNVVAYGNEFAEKYLDVFSGKKSRALKKKMGEIWEMNVDEVRIENDSRNLEADDEYKKHFRKEGTDDYDEFLPKNNYLKAQYLKICSELISENTRKSFLFLSRKRRGKGLNWEEFFDADCKEDNSFMAKCLNDQEINFPDSIEFKTMHSSKGLEADIVVLLDVCERTIPLIHPSNMLFEVFGRTPDKILDEEKRLFYVAITRAKEQLIILTEKNRESSFLK